MMLRMDASALWYAASSLLWGREPLGDLGSLAGQPIGVAFAVPLDQTMRLHFAQIVAELIQPVARSGEFEGSQEGVVDLLGSPSADRGAAMQ